jgi:hypothetical protein
VAGYLLDTNVISELRRGARANARVKTWVAAVESRDIYLSVVTLAEIRMGIRRLEAREPAQAALLERWRLDLEDQYGRLDRLLPVDARVAVQWGDLQKRRPVPVLDCLLAATAVTHGLVLATRNTADLTGLEVEVVNPWRS